MAQYDGSIRIDTGINTDGIKKGVQEIAKDIERLKSMQKEFLDIGGSKEDSIYKEREKEIKKLEQTLKSLNNTQKEFRKQEQIPDKHWNQLKIDVEEYAKALKELQSQGKFFGDEEYDKVYLAWKNATDAVKEYQAELNKQTESGKSKIAEQEAKAAERKEAAQRKAAEQAERALQKENDRIQKQIENEAKLQAKEAERQAKLKAEAAEEEHLDKIRLNAVATNDEIIAKVERIKQLEQEIADLKTVERTEGYADYDDRITELSKLKHDVSEYKDSLSDVPERFSKMRAAAQKTFNAISSGLSIIGNIGKKTFLSISGMAKKAFSAITGGSKQANTSLSGGLKTILKYGLGIRSLYVLFNKIRSGIQQGFTNLMDYSGDFANSIQSVKNSMSTLGNQIAAAFSPIVQMVIPWINSLINTLSIVMSYVAQFIAALTGGSTFTRAKKVQDAYSKSLGGTAKAADKARGALAKFDDLDVFQKQEDISGGGAGAVGNMFEEVPISDKWKNIADWFREMWENSSFYELGKLLGEMLRDALNGIDWEPIKETTQKIGKLLATFINGFIEVEGLGESIGRTLAEAFNTAFEFLNAFVHELHWESIGKFISDTINGFFNNIDWGLIRDSLITAVKGFGNAINEFVDNLDWEEIATAVSDFIDTLVDTIYTFITTTDWIAIAEHLGQTLSDAFVGIDWIKAGETVGEAFKSFFDFIATAIENVDWWAVGESVKDFLTGIDWAGVADSFFEAVGAAIGGFAAFIGGLISDGVEEAKTYFADKIEEAGGNVAEGILNGIAEGMKNIGNWIKEHIFNPIINGFKNAFGIHSPSTVMTEMGGYIIEGLINGLLSLKDKPVETIKEIGSDLVDGFRSLFGIHSPSTVMDENGVYLMEGLANGISESMHGVLEIFGMLGMAVTEILAPMSENVVMLFTEMTAMILKSWVQMLSQTRISWTELNALITKSLSIINTNISNGMTTALDNWTSRWNQLAQKTRTSCMEIISAVSAMNDSVMSMCDSMIAAIDSVKSAASSLGSIGGGNFGGGISAVSVTSRSLEGVPALATGAVIRGGNPFMAILGDQPAGKTNIEAPLSTIEQAMENVMSRHGSSGERIPVNINVIYDGETTARVMIPDILAELGRQGYNVDLLGYT